jgi:DNA-binding GntR family transcriptional regulator
MANASIRDQQARRSRSRETIRAISARSGARRGADRVGLICGALRRAIIERALAPGAKLPEDSLGERFGVSRTIARQALGRLAAEGLVELRRNRISVVATPSWEEARDAFDVRKELERLVAQELAGNLTRAQLAELRAHVAEEEAARGQADAVSIRLATEFHILLASMTDRPVLIRYVSELSYRCCLTISLYGRPHSSECAVKEHRTIIDALAAGHAQKAADLMHHHLEAVAERALVAPGKARSQDLREIISPYAGTPRTPPRRRLPARSKA